MLSTLAPVSRLLFGFFLFCICVGLHSTLIGVRATLDGFEPIHLGLMMSAYYCGFVFGSQAIEKLIHHIGHIRTFATIGACLATLTLVYVLWVHPVHWILLRFIHGTLVSGGYMVIESWLNGLSTKENRGRVMSVYLILNSLGLAGGQMFFKFSDGTGFLLFAISSMLASIAMIPLLLSNLKQPAKIETTSVLPVSALFTLSPLAVIGAIGMGLVNGAFFGLCAPMLLRHGLDSSHAAQFISAAFIGGLLFQWPLGSLSDRINRRWVLLGSTLMASLMAACVAFLTAQPELNYTLLLLCGLGYGGFCFPVYSLLIALANDRVESNMYVRVSRALLMLNGSGAIAGPLLASASVSHFGDAGLFTYISAVFFTLALICLSRIFFGRRLPQNVSH